VVKEQIKTERGESRRHKKGKKKKTLEETSLFIGDFNNPSPLSLAFSTKQAGGEQLFWGGERGRVEISNRGKKSSEAE